MQYIARTSWKNNANSFTPKTFDRTHKVTFGSGFSIEASAAPEFAGRADLPNPEELFTAAIASCYMLTFLYIAATEGFVIDQYQSEAIGTLAKNDEGRLAVTEINLKPDIAFAENKVPDEAKLQTMLKKAHDQCFISCSVKTKVVINTGQLTLA